MNCVVSTRLLLITKHLADGQGEKAGLAETHREKFEEALRWKLSAGDPSGDTKIEVSGNHVRITLTGSKFWNDATASFDAKYFGLLFLLWDIEARDQNQREYVLTDSFDITLVQSPDWIVARAFLNLTD